MSTATPAGKGPRRARRRWGVFLVKLAAAVFLGLSLLEVLLRVVDPMRSDRALENLRGFYRLDAAGRIETNPGWRGEWRIGNDVTTIATSSQGLRGADLPAKAEAERRVLMLGDSFVWGSGVEAGQTIPAALERLLRHDGASVTVGNAGMWGTGPREWGYTFERHRGWFQPDLAIAVCYVGNDLGDSLNEPMSVVDGHLMPGAIAHAMRDSWRWNLALHLRTWWYLETKVLARIAPPQVTPLAQLIPGGIDPALALEVRDERQAQAPWIGPVLGVMRTHFAAFAEALHGTKALVVLLPPYEEIARGQFSGFVAPVQALNLSPDDFARGNAARRLAGVLAELGLPVLDLSPRFFAHSDPGSLCLIDRHYNEAGCAQVAEWLLPAVRELLGP